MGLDPTDLGEGTMVGFSRHGNYLLCSTHADIFFTAQVTRLFMTYHRDKHFIEIPLNFYDFPTLSDIMNDIRKVFPVNVMDFTEFIASCHSPCVYGLGKSNETYGPRIIQPASSIKS
jgi:hypothetical protein